MSECPLHLKYFPDLYRALGQMTGYLEGRCQERGIGVSEAQALSVIHCHEECSVGELGKEMGLKPSTLTSLLNRLADRDLIFRRTHPEDRRTFVVGLTETGLILAKWVYEVASEMEKKIEDQLGEDEIAGFGATLQAIKEVTGSDRSNQSDSCKENMITDPLEKVDQAPQEPQLESK